MKQKFYILAIMILGIVFGSEAKPQLLKLKDAHTPAVKLAGSHMRPDGQNPRAARTFRTTRNIPTLTRTMMRANASGSELYAYRLMPEGIPSLISFQYDGTETLQWEGSEYWVPSTGFLHEGKLYGISATYFYGSFYIDRIDLDPLTGEMTYAESMGDSPTMAAISAAYDPIRDEGYAYTYTEAIDGYMFNRFDLDTFSFTPINQNVDQNDVCLAMTYDERREILVGMTADGRLVAIDPTTGSGELLCRLPDSPAFYGTSIVFSPLDNAYVCQMILAAGGNSIVRIDADTHQAETTHKWGADEIRQYTIMFCQDDVFASAAPARPVLEGLEVKDPELSGILKIGMPNMDGTGEPLTESLDLIVKVDGTVYTRRSSLCPGSSVDIPIENMAEGLHTFSIKALQGEEIGAPLIVRHCFGYDTPEIPENVRLDDGMVFWDAVTEGVNGGFIGEIIYEILLNGEKIGETYSTYMCIELPEEYTYNRVEVVAVSNGKRSEPGSTGVLPGGLIPLGTSLHPDEQDWPAFTVIDGDGDGDTWTCDSWYGIFYNPEENGAVTANETLVTPAYKVVDGSVRHALSFIAGEDGLTEGDLLELYKGKEPDPSAMEKVAEISLDHSDKRHEVYILPEEGPCYFAFRLTTPVPVFISDIMLEATEVLATAPDNVRDIVVVPADLGVERATVSFTLPDKAINGTPLVGNVEASVTSEAETVTTTGRPGERVQVSLRVPEGMARVSVQTKGGTPVYSEYFYSGADLPRSPQAYDYKLTEDNMEVTLTWSAPTEGMHDAWFDPASIYYEVQVFSDEEGWLVLDDDLEETTFTYRLPDGAPQRAWYFYVTPCNSVGKSEDVLSIPVAMGAPYPLPLTDSMVFGGSKGPLMTEGGDEYGAGWSVSFPEWYEEGAAEIQDYIIIGTNEGTPTKGLLILPKFNPASGERVNAYFRFYFGDKTPDINLYVMTYSQDKKLVKQVKAKDMPKGYQTVVVTLPEEISRLPWAQVAVEAVYDGIPQCLIFPSYEVYGAYSNDCAVAGLVGKGTITLGEANRYVVTLRNDGYESTALPEVALELCRGDKSMALADLVTTDLPATLRPGESVEIPFKLSVDHPEWLGGCELVAAVASKDKNAMNDEMKRTVTISAGNSPVVTDLRAAPAEAGGVLLTWSHPVVGSVAEGFENCDPAVVESSLGEFLNIDGDGELTKGYCFPYHTPQESPTGWVVWDRIEIENAPYNNSYAPFNGNRMAVALASDFGDPVDDWLISPPVAGGSEISFAIAAGMSGMKEELQVMASSTGTDMSDFVLVERISYKWEDWDTFTVALPADARYFALRYVGSGCCLFLDDLTYTPALAQAEYIGYDVFRNGMQVAENVASDCRYTDSSAKGSEDVYRVRPIYRLDGETLRGHQSNLAGLSISGVDEILLSGVEVAGGSGEVTLRNALGLTVRLVGVDGRLISVLEPDSDEVRVSCAPGVMLVGIGNRFWKVLVR